MASLETKKAEQLFEVLQFAVKCGDVEAVKLFKINDAELSRSAPFVSGSAEVSCTLLHQAAEFQDPHMASYLLNFMSSDVTDARGRTPLHYAAEHEHHRHNEQLNCYPSLLRSRPFLS